MQDKYLYVGISETTIDPPEGYMMGMNGLPAKGTSAPLYSRVLFIKNSEISMIICTLDLLGIDHYDAVDLSKRISAETRVSEDAVLINCSHTHAAPTVLSTLHTRRKAFNKEFTDDTIATERAWLSVLMEQIVKQSKEASKRLKRASVGTISAWLPWLIYNRRRITRDYGTWTVLPKIPENQAYMPEGPIDDELGIIVFRDSDQNPLCYLWNFAGHNAFHFKENFSGDLSHYVSQEIDTRLGDHLPGFYLPGCCGNMAYTGPKDADERLDYVKNHIADAILSRLYDVCTIPEPVLSCKKVTLLVPHKDVSKNFWEREIELKRRWFHEGEYPEKERERFQKEGKDFYPCTITVFRFASIVLVGIAAEVFSEFGLHIKSVSPSSHTFIVGYSNGFSGYLITRKASKGGSYEVWPVLNSRIEKEGGYAVSQKALEMIQEMHIPAIQNREVRLV